VSYRFVISEIRIKLRSFLNLLSKTVDDVCITFDINKVIEKSSYI